MVTHRACGRAHQNRRAWRFAEQNPPGLASSGSRPSTRDRYSIGSHAWLLVRVAYTENRVWKSGASAASVGRNPRAPDRLRPAAVSRYAGRSRAAATPRQVPGRYTPTHRNPVAGSAVQRAVQELLDSSACPYGKRCTRPRAIRISSAPSTTRLGRVREPGAPQLSRLRLPKTAPADPPPMMITSLICSLTVNTSFRWASPWTAWQGFERGLRGCPPAVRAVHRAIAEEVPNSRSSR
jgi:hypothetical protein